MGNKTLHPFQTPTYKFNIAAEDTCLNISIDSTYKSTNSIIGLFHFFVCVEEHR
jgi:hypothetical protein